MNSGTPVNIVTSPVPPGPGEDEIDLRELFWTIMDGRFLLLAVATIVVVLGAAYAVLSTRIYEADALVQVEMEGKSIDAALGDVAELLGGEVEVRAEIEILRSRMVVGRVVDSLGLELEVRPYYLPLVGSAISRYLDHEPGILAPTFLGLSSFAWGGEVLDVQDLKLPKGLLGEKLTLRVEEDGFSLFGPEEMRMFAGALLIAGRVGERVSADTPHGRIEIFVQELTARPAVRFELTRDSRTETIAKLQKKLKVSERGKDSGILAVSLQGDDLERVTNTVNKIVEVYQRQNVERKSAEAAQTLDFLDRQLPKIKQELEAAEAALNNYRLKRGSADLTKETELILQQSIELETTRVQLQQKREEVLQRFTPGHPVIQAIDAQLRDVQSEAGKIANLVKDLPQTQQEVLRLARDVEVNTVLYTALLNNAQELQVVKAGTVGNVRIIDFAVPPIKPVKPRTVLVVVLSAVLGVFLGLIAVFVRRAFHAGVADPAEVERVLGVPAYAAIPYAAEQRRIGREIARSADRERLLAVLDPDCVAMEALRSLRTSLHFALLEAPNNIIMLTGPAPGLGKSFVSLNLGAVLALSGRRVAVVDLDLRRGHLHKYLGSEREPGFTDCVTGTADRESATRKTSIPNLVVMPTGTVPPNPSELLMNERVVQLLQKLSADFDYVIVDTPPVLAVTDAALVGRLAGTTMLVLKAGEHPMRMIDETLRRLKNAGVSVRGTLFNCVGASGRASAYGYAYSYEYKRETA